MASSICKALSLEVANCSPQDVSNLTIVQRVAVLSMCLNLLNAVELKLNNNQDLKNRSFSQLEFSNSAGSSLDNIFDTDTYEYD